MHGDSNGSAYSVTNPADRPEHPDLVAVSAALVVAEVEEPVGAGIQP
ncbi:hypothetical protein ACLF6K_02630 [Streptomyces xanthophaeus]